MFCCLLCAEFSPVLVAEEGEEEEGALSSGELLLPDVPSHEPGGPGHHPSGVPGHRKPGSLQHLSQTVRRRVDQLLATKPNKKYKEKSSTSAC